MSCGGHIIHTSAVAHVMCGGHIIHTSAVAHVMCGGHIMRHVHLTGPHSVPLPQVPGAMEHGITSDDLFYLDKPPGKT